MFYESENVREFNNVTRVYIRKRIMVGAYLKEERREVSLTCAMKEGRKEGLETLLEVVMMEGKEEQIFDTKLMRKSL